MADLPVVVIGAGPIGLSIAHELARNDVEVVVVERGHVGSGAARRNAGWIVPIMAAPVPAPGVVSHALRWMLNPESPLRVAPDPDLGHIAFMARMLLASSARRHARGLAAVGALARGSLELFEQYAADGIEFEMHRDGVLLAFLSREERDRHRPEYASAAQHGYADVCDLTAADVADLEPGLSRRVVAGLLSPDQAFIDPGTFVDGLARRLTALGVPILTEQTDPQIRREAGGALFVQTTTFRTPAAKVVIAAGAASTELTASVGFRMPLRFGKGYGFDLSPAPTQLRHAVYLSEAKVAATPLARGLRLAGTMEFGGDPQRIDQRRARGIIKSSTPYFAQDLGATPSPFAGLRPMTPDGLPVIGPVPNAPGVFLATGHAMLGITLAPRTAQIVTELLLSGLSPDVLTPFSPARFARRSR